jgi:hypothetical protein
MSEDAQTKVKKTNNMKLLGYSLATVVAVGSSFILGIQYQKKHADTAASQPNTANSNFGVGEVSPGNGMMGGRGMAMYGNAGSVTKVSSTSITVQNARTQNTTTYTIDSNTKVQDGTTKKTVDDIKTGDSVIVQTSTANKNIATTILVNVPIPSARGMYRSN